MSKGLWMYEKVVSWDKTIPGEDAVKTTKMATKCLKYYKNLFDKATAMFDSIFNEALMWVKCYQMSL